MNKTVLGCLIFLLLTVLLIAGCVLYFWSNIQGGIATARESIGEILEVGNVLQAKYETGNVHVGIHSGSDGRRLNIELENYELPEGRNAEEMAREIARTAYQHSQPDWKLDEVRVEFKIVQRIGPAHASTSSSFSFEIDELAESTESEVESTVESEVESTVEGQ